MSRRPTRLVSGVIYHVSNRVSRGQHVFRDEAERFETLLAATMKRADFHYLLRRHFDRNVAIQQYVESPMHDAHSILAGFVDDAVMAEGATDGITHRQGSQRGCCI